MELEERQRLARALAGNPLLEILLDEFRDETFTRWETNTDEVVQRECWATIRAISKFRSYLKNAIGDTGNGKGRAENK